MKQFLAAALVLQFAAHASLAGAPMDKVAMPLGMIHFQPDDDVKCLSSALETGDPARGPSTFALKAPPGCVVPWHYHTAQEQAIVIGGDVTMEMAGHAPMQLGVGGFAVMEGNVPHRFACSGKAACIIIVVFNGAYDIFWGKEKK